MRINTSLWGALVALVAAFPSVSAQEVAHRSALEAEEAPQTAAPPTAAPVAVSPLFSESPVATAKPLRNCELKATETSTADAVTSRARAKAKAPTKVADLVGPYVQTYKTLTSSGVDGGNSVIISAVTGSSDSILIQGWYSTGSIKAAVDFTTKTVSIPAQYIATHSTYGDLDLALCTSTGKPDRTQNIVGTINDDGTISITSWWGVFVNSGDYADAYFYAGYSTEFEPANSTMTIKVKSSSTDSDGNPVYNNYGYYVIAEQTAKNVLAVKNFAGLGHTVELVLNRDSTSTIEQQVVRVDATYGSWYSIGGLTFNDDGNLTGYSKTITTDKATDARTITWGNWSWLCSGYFAGNIVESTITTSFDISYPSLSVSELEGKGTEAEPYLIKTADDLILLSDKVKAVSEFTCTTPPVNSSYYARIYKDEYFSIENDIDLEGIRFTPIGNDWQHVFAGTIDGKNHTIKGLNVSASGTYGYGGLFGHADTVSVIKNIVLDAPIVSGSSYTGGIVGWSKGIVDNCHVTNPTITNSSYGTAGIGGVVRTMTNCSVTGGTINGSGGYVAGVAGQIGLVKTYEGYIENCYAEDVTITCAAAADGYPSGGVIGTLYHGSAKYCWFKGTIDGYSKYSSNQVLGGVSGAVTYSTIDQCFSVGTIHGYDSKAQLGGVAGNCVASTITNCYAAGRVDDLSSKYCGGLIGYLRPYTTSGVTTGSTVQDCYTSVQTTAETYQYDRTSEYREIFGTIESDSLQTIVNVFFDQKVNDKTSLKYGVTTDYLTAESGVTAFSPTVWTFAKGQYPRLTKFADTEAAKFSASAILTEETSALHRLFADATLTPLGNTKYAFYKGGKFYTSGHYTTIENNVLKVGTEIGTDTLYVYNGSTAYYLFVKSSPLAFKGTGSETDPYLIQNKTDLVALSQATTVGKQLFQDIYFKITNDIDLEYDTDFVGICSDKDDAYNKFAGTIDGDGHTIHKMDIVSAAWSVTNAPDEDGVLTIDTSYGKSYKGFVGRLASTGTVKNVIIAADCNLNGVFASTGAVVGYVDGGVVENCKNYADVMGYSCWIGGVVGQNIKGTIRNCYNEGNITTGYFNVGGIVGTTSGLVENCANAGTVTVKRIASNFPKSATNKFNDAGGISGTTAGTLIKNCLNVGTVKGETAIGGVCATLPKASTTALYTNDIVNTINYGAVWCDDLANAGAFSGTYLTTGTISNNYYDSQIITYPAAGNLNVTGITPAETSVLTSGTALEGYDTDIWQFDAGQYPVLKQFASEPKLANARKVIVSMPAGVTAADLSEKATLATVDGLSWSLVNGKVFTISENSLVPPASVSEVVTDTLVATYGDYSKELTVQRVSGVPLSGAGTEADPYLITSVEDWNKVTAYVDETYYTFEEEYIKLTADLDFDGAEINKFACDGATKFMGTFDGNGKTLSNYTLTTTANYQGLFGIVSAEATIKNLTVGGTVSTAYTFTGGLVSKLYGKLIGCVNTGKVTTTKGNTGGLVAQAYTGAEITDCVNKGEISRTAAGIYTGGVASNTEAGVTFTRCGNEAAINNASASTYTAGVVAYALPSTFIDCYNTGDISSTGTTTAAVYVAGVIGYANGAANSERYLIKGCYNTGDITGAAALAGIVANSGTTAGNAKLTIEDCYNTGDIVTTASKSISGSPAAGIISRYAPGAIIRNCYNTGNIINSLSVYTSGIAGYYSTAPTATYPVEVTNCYNAGNIVASGNQGAGIMVYVGAYVTVDSCYNVGNIEGTWGLGGIVGQLGAITSKVSNCWNAGKITGSQNRIGGVIGLNTAAATIDNCWNLGDVSTTADTKGTSTSTTAPSGYAVGGICGTSGSVLTNCYNVGTITGASQVGGIVGQTVKAKTQLVSCYNAGKIVADADTCGAFVGVKLTENTTRWTEGNAITDCYYVTDYNTFTNEQLGTGVKIADLAKLDLGSAWTSADNYSFPIHAGQGTNPGALAGSAAVVLSGEDTYDNITSTVYVGLPQGVEWTSSLAPFSVADNQADFGNIDTETPVVLTVAAGDVTRAWNLTIKKAVSGINDINANGKTIVDQVYYDLSGRVVPTPISADGNLYIVKITYDDNTIQVVKLINK